MLALPVSANTLLNSLSDAYGLLNSECLPLTVYNIDAGFLHDTPRQISKTSYCLMLKDDVY